MADKENKPEKPEEKMTPEERLFKVIATGGRDIHYGDDKESDFVDQDPFTKIEDLIQKIKGFFQHGFFDRFKNWTPAPTPAARPAFGGHYAWTENLGQVLRLKTINKTLMVLVGVLGFYLVFDFVFGGAYRPMKLADSLSVQEIVRPGQTLLPSEDLSRYLNPAAARNVFLPPAPPAPGQSSGTSEGGAPPKVNFKLVGISWDADEYVAMLEYEGEKGAHFVRKGETLQSGIKVENISEYAVALSQGNTKWDLT